MYNNKEKYINYLQKIFPSVEIICVKSIDSIGITPTTIVLEIIEKENKENE